MNLGKYARLKRIEEIVTFVSNWLRLADLSFSPAECTQRLFTLTMSTYINISFQMDKSLFITQAAFKEWPNNGVPGVSCHRTRVFK